MAIVQNVATILGLVLSIAAVGTLCSKTLKGLIVRMFKKYGDEEDSKRVLEQLQDLSQSLTEYEQMREHLVNDLKQDIDNLSQKLDAHIEEQQVEQYNKSRQHILEFAYKLCRGEQPDIEYTENIMECIDVYKFYCETHPNYPNSKADTAIKRIENYYRNITTN